MKTSFRNVMIGIVFGGICLLSSVPAHAVSIKLFEENSGALVVVTDNGVGDLNPMVGAVVFTGPVGNVILDLTTGLSKPLIGNSNSAMLTLTQLAVTAMQPARLTVSLTDTGFTVPAMPMASFLSEIGGVLTGTGGSVEAWSYVDLDNAPFGTGGSSLYHGVFGPGAFADSLGTSFVNNGSPFSMTQVALMKLNPYSVVSFDAHSKVPEPSAMLLMGTGLIVLAVWGRRRLVRQQEITTA